jgi:hypothetical protein
MNRNVRIVDVRINATNHDRWTLYGLYDVHLDNTLCARRELDKCIATIAANDKARVALGGDFFDLMWALGDPRYSPSQVPPWLRGNDNPVGRVMDEAITLLDPIKDKIDIVLAGNHELTYAKRHGVNLAQELAGAMGAPYSGVCGILGYYFSCGGSTTIVNGYLHHGKGGEAPMTGNTLDIMRALLIWPTIQFTMRGHKHDARAIPLDYGVPAGDFGNRRIRQMLRANVSAPSFLKTYSNDATAYFGETQEHRFTHIGPGVIHFDVVRKESGLEVYPVCLAD